MGCLGREEADAVADDTSNREGGFARDEEDRLWWHFF